MIREFIELNPTLDSAAYPPYHRGDYLEQYFMKYYSNHEEDFKKSGCQFIPIAWTDIYNHRKDIFQDIQDRLDKLDSNGYYFTVSQHDDAPMFHKFPSGTTHFSAGGNASNTIAIPLICSPIIDTETKDKDIFCSFVGSMTHPIRMKMLDVLVDNKDYVLKPKHWTLDVNDNRKELFLDITKRSKYSLCPRGYGTTSFRLYEAMQLNCVPVYISDNFHLPFDENYVNWGDISILINSKEIDDIDEILKSISDDRYEEILKNMKETYRNFFAMEKTCDTILKILTNGKL